MNRTAIYSQDKGRRVISVPNGLWRLQEYDSKGSAPTREFDPWFYRGAPTEREDAIRAMGK